MDIKELLKTKEGRLADLRGADLEGANLGGADLRWANLRWANLREADLRGADLRGADLRGADLEGANLRWANLREADLRGADLRGADLEGANLRWANLREADLREADLREADLRGADLRGADLRGANLRGADLPHYSIVPSEGTFIAWKKTTEGVIKVEIPSDSERVSTLVGRKCRASKVRVLSGAEGCSPNKGSLTYQIGKTVEADKFDDDIRVECTNGIHFFMTEKEAEEW